MYVKRIYFCMHDLHFRQAYVGSEVFTKNQHRQIQKSDAIETHPDTHTHNHTEAQTQIFSRCENVTQCRWCWNVSLDIWICLWADL